MLGSEGNKLDGPTALNLIQTLCESRIDLATLRLDGNPLGTPEAPCLWLLFVVCGGLQERDGHSIGHARRVRGGRR